jgi:hypothetical protein
MHPARLLRRLGVELHKVGRGASTEHRKLRERLAMAFLATLLFDFAATALMCWLESGRVDPGISSPFESFFWVTTQLLTVSSQLQNPVTTAGRVLDMIIQLWAITVVAAVAGSFAAFLQRSPEQARGAEP